MQPHHFSIIGLAVDIVGAFFVSIEAIKLDNFRALRERVLRVAHEYTLSPRLYFVNEDGDSEDPLPDPVPANRYPGVFMALHYLAGAIVLFVLDRLTDGWVLNSFVTAVVWTLDRPWYLILLIAIFFVIFGVFMGLWLLGELVHVSMTAALRGSIKVVDFVEEKTPSGTLGMIGFLLLLVGFLLQILGTYLGAP